MDTGDLRGAGEPGNWSFSMQIHLPKFKYMYLHTGTFSKDFFSQRAVN